MKQIPDRIYLCMCWWLYKSVTSGQTNCSETAEACSLFLSWGSQTENSPSVLISMERHDLDICLLLVVMLFSFKFSLMFGFMVKDGNDCLFILLLHSELHWTSMH